MARSKTYYRKVDGSYTTKVKEYVDSWDSIRIPLEQKLNLRTIGIDPGFLMEDVNGYGSTVNIPVWLAKRILSKISS